MDNNECLSNIKSVSEYNEMIESDILSMRCDECVNFEFSGGIGICKKFSNSGDNK